MGLERRIAIELQPSLMFDDDIRIGLTLGNTARVLEDLAFGPQPHFTSDGKRRGKTDTRENKRAVRRPSPVVGDHEASAATPQRPGRTDLVHQALSQVSLHVRHSRRPSGSGAEESCDEAGRIRSSVNHGLRRPPPSPAQGRRHLPFVSGFGVGAGPGAWLAPPLSPRLG